MKLPEEEIKPFISNDNLADNTLLNFSYLTNSPDASEGDHSEGGTLEVNISGEADGIQMYTRSLPLFNIELKEV